MTDPAAQERSGVFVVAAIAASIGAVGVFEALRSFPFGTLARPGPGLYSTVVSVLMIFTAIGSTLEALRRRSEESEPVWPPFSDAWRPISFAVAVAAAIALIDHVGYMVTMTVLSFVVLSVMEGKSVLRNAILALLFGVGTYYLFVVALKTPLPSGAWFN